MDVAENWQSKYLQSFLYIVPTVWDPHRGSPESKTLDRPGREPDQDQHGALHAQLDSPQSGFTAAGPVSDSSVTSPA